MFLRPKQSPATCVSSIRTHSVSQSILRIIQFRCRELLLSIGIFFSTTPSTSIEVPSTASSVSGAASCSKPNTHLILTAGLMAIAKSSHHDAARGESTKTGLKLGNMPINSCLQPRRALDTFKLDLSWRLHAHPQFN